MVDALYGGDTGTYDASEARAPSAWWRLLQLGLAVLMGGVLLLPLWLLRVASAMRYDIVGDELRVPGLLGTRTVRLPGARVELHGHHRRGRMIRVAGAALPGLHMGLYRAQGRWVHMSATSLRDVVVVQGPERTVLVTPAEPGAFVQALVARGAVRA